MKILIINTYAEIRSTGKITTLLYHHLKESGYEVIVCYRGARQPKVDNIDYAQLDSNFYIFEDAFFSMLIGNEGQNNNRGTRKLLKIIDEFHPDIVQLYSLHGYYLNHFKLLDYLKKNNIATVYSMIDEYPYMGKCCYSYDCNQFITECISCPQYNKSYPKSLFIDNANKIFNKKKDVYKDFINIIFTGPKWVCERAKLSALMKGQRIEELNEPINFNDIFYPRDTKNLRKKLHIPIKNKIVITVTDMKAKRKGGQYFIEVAKNLLNNENITFVFVGFNIKQNVPSNVIKIPFVKDQSELAEYYSLGDIFVCTSLADTMPNVCLEALGCGTPLCGFAEAGTPYCAKPPLGIFTKTYDINALAKVIINAPIKNKYIKDDCVKYAHDNFSDKAVFNRLIKIYRQLIKNKRDDSIQ